jgi:hypothetical protein
MRVLTRVSHSDHDIGTEYECDDAVAPRLLASGTVVDPTTWTYSYSVSTDIHTFTPPAEVKPALPDVERAADPINTTDARTPKTRS